MKWNISREIVEKKSKLPTEISGYSVDNLSTSVDGLVGK